MLAWGSSLSSAEDGSLLQPVGALGSWAGENRSRILQARLRFDAKEKQRSP